MKKRLVGLALLAGTLSASAANKTLSPSDDIVNAVSNAGDGDVITLKAGLYEVQAPNGNNDSAAFNITKAVTIVGETGNPADVIVRNTAGLDKVTKTGNTAGSAYRVFRLSNAKAVLSGITVEGGRIGEAYQGGNIRIASGGGTVTNCIIRNAVTYAFWGNAAKTGASGSGIYCSSANGLITHCVITNNFLTRKSTTQTSFNQGGAAAVHMTGGLIRDSLIAYNSTKDDNMGSAVYISGSGTLMENCTIAGNYVENDNGCFYPVMYVADNVQSKNPVVQNTLIYGNTGAAGSTDLFTDAYVNSYKTPLSKTPTWVKFENCATDWSFDKVAQYGLTMTVATGISDDFHAVGQSSSTVDAGAEMKSPVDLDLAGVQRVIGEAVDIGCYEYKSNAGAVEDPVFTQASGTEFYPTVMIELTCATDGATIHYTTNGDVPTAESMPYTGAIELNATTTIKAIACKESLTDSSVVSATYTRVEPQPPALGVVKVAPGADRATISGTIASAGNLDATACDVYLKLGDGVETKIAENVTDSFKYVIQGLELSTEYTYTLTVKNNATYEQSVSTVGSFTTKSSADPFDYCVSEDGDDANDGTARDSAFKTIAKAVEVAEDGNLIWVLKGTYEVSSAISVTKAITIAGEPGDPAEVVVRNTAGSAVTRELRQNNYGAFRVFEINNAGAVLSGLTAEGGRIGGAADNKGGNVLIDTNGGMVTNCILRNAIAVGIGMGPWAKSGVSGAGIASYSKNGLITHCVITNNFLTRGTAGVTKWGDGASGVHVVSGGVLRESLIAYNTIGDDPMGVAVFIDSPGTLIENCTIAKNTSEYDELTALSFTPQAWNVGADRNPLFRNTLVYGNGPKLFTDNWVEKQLGSDQQKATNAYSRFTSCATDAAIPEGLEGKVIHGENVKVMPRFSPTPSSSIVDAGAEMQSPVDLDLAGKQRIYGAAVDIGCYEYIPKGTIISFK